MKSLFFAIAFLYLLSHYEIAAQSSSKEETLGLIMNRIAEIQNRLALLQENQDILLERQFNDTSINDTLFGGLNTTFLNDFLNNPDAIFNDSVPAAPPPFNVSSIGAFLDIAVAPASPFLFYDASKIGAQQFSGYSVDFMTKMLSLMELDGFLIQIKYHYYDSIGSSLDAEYLGRVDCAMSAIAITSRREQKFTFTAAYYDSGLQVLAPQYSSGANLSFLFLPFTWKLWVLIIGTVFLLGNLLWIFERTTEGESDLASSYLAGCFDGVYFVGAKLMGGGDFGMKRVASKILYIGLTFMSVIFVASYTANLAAVLTITNLQAKFYSVNDLGGKQVGYVKSDSKTDTSTVEDYFNLNSDIRPILVPYSTEEAMFADGEAGNLDAIICELPTAQYYLTKTNPASLLGFVGVPFTSDGFGIALKQGVQPSLLAILNYYIIVMREGGYQDVIYNEWFGRTTSSSTPSVTPLDISSMATLFVVMAIIFGIALPLFVAHKFLGIENSKYLWGQTEEQIKENRFNKTVFHVFKDTENADDN